jgi:putative tricarboxylic transport membrane protein
MENDMFDRGLRAALCAGLFAALAPGPAASQPAWRPDKPVELVVPTATGGNNDRMLRLVQKVLQEQKLVTTPVLVLNKPGGNQHLAVVYIGQHAADPHYIMMTNSTIFTNELNGLSKQPYTHLTPLALMIVESNAFTVGADSPLKSMRDVMARLKADPESLSFAMPARGGVTHIALAAAVKAAGLDPRRLKIVVFKTSGESITSIAGGHVDVMVSSLASVMGVAQAGKARVLGIAARERRGGAAAEVPTLREQGINTDAVAAWRGLSGPPALAPQHVAFWDETLAKVFESPDWKDYLAKNDLPPQYLRSRDFAQYLRGEYETTRAVMADIGLAR